MFSSVVRLFVSLNVCFVHKIFEIFNFMYFSVKRDGPDTTHTYS